MNIRFAAAIRIVATLALGTICALSGRAVIVTLNGQGYLYLEKPNLTTIPIPDETTTPPTDARLYWNPLISAFRFGKVNLSWGTETAKWGASNLGQFSFAGGENAVALGDYSFSFGYGTYAAENGSVAMGMGARAEGSASLAVGDNSYALSPYSVALGSGWISGYGGFGVNSDATGDGVVSINGGAYGALALAINGNAWEESSVGIGGGSSFGARAIALGLYAYANGDDTVAIGHSVTTTAPFGTSLGRFNLNKRKDGTDPNGGSSDPIFEVGNGTSSSATSNAFTVYRDGETKVAGQLNVAGAVVAANFSGSGSGITGINASNLSTGTISDGRLSLNIPRLSAANAFAGQITTTGNMGIGTSAPSSALEISGSNKAIKMTTPADSGYRLTLENNYNWSNSMNLRGVNDTVILGVYSGNTALMTGNVGIGTTSPAARAHIVATSSTESTTVGFTDTLRLQAANGTAGGVNLQTAWDNSINSSKLNFRLGYYASGTQSRDVLTMVANTGNVGVGTTSPAYSLDIQGTFNTSSATALRLKSTHTNGYGGGLRFDISNGVGASYTAAFINAENSNNTSTDGGMIRFYTAAEDTSHTLTQRMVINSGGNVGIGTATPSSKLDVAGELRVTGAGNTIFKGVVLVTKQGDLEMGDFTAGANPNNL